MTSSGATSVQEHSTFSEVGRSSCHRQDTSTYGLKPTWLQSKDASKRKRVNRIAKLKQCKLDARREQWLSQGSCGLLKHMKREGEDSTTGSRYGDPSAEAVREPTLSYAPDRHLGSQPLKNDMRSDGGSSLTIHATDTFEDNTLRCRQNWQPDVQDLICTGNRRTGKASWGANLQHGLVSIEICDVQAVQTKSNMEALCVPAQHLQLTSVISSAESNVVSSGDFISQGITIDEAETQTHRLADSMQKLSLGQKWRQGQLSEHDNSASQSREMQCARLEYGGSSDKDTRYLDAEDDWETVADAIYVHNNSLESGETVGRKFSKKVDLPSITASISDGMGSLTESLKSEYKFKAGGVGGPEVRVGKAWRPDDAARPPTLPRLTDQHSVSLIKSSRAGMDSPEHNPWGQASTPLFCPICTEELDLTDSSFVPCHCGFRLCLFCHHRIASDDGRCPGCRRIYDSDAAIKPSHDTSVWLRI